MVPHAGRTYADEQAVSPDAPLSCAPPKIGPSAEEAELNPAGRCPQGALSGPLDGPAEGERVGVREPEKGLRRERARGAWLPRRRRRSSCRR